MGNSLLKRKMVINHDYKNIKDFLKKIPSKFRKSGTTIYEARNVIKTFEFEGLTINVKSFKKPHILNQFVYATFRKSKAKRSYYYAKELLNQGIKTPTPIAYIEYKYPLAFRYSYYVSEQVDADGMLREMREGTLQDHKELIKQFAEFTARLHKKSILHIDYSPGNILYMLKDGVYEFYLVDLNRMTFNKPISMEAACNNFRRLWGNDDMIRYFVKVYANARGFDVEKSTDLTLKYRDEFWTSFAKRHPDATPYIG